MTTPKAVRAFLARAGRKGGTTRAKRLTAAERSAGARKAAAARWAKAKAKKPRTG